MTVPRAPLSYGLGAGAIDASVNHYVANHYSSSVMNFLHCFYGVGAVISPCIMAQALKVARWNEGYRWTAYIQAGILLVCVLSLPLWKRNETAAEAENRNDAGIELSPASIVGITNRATKAIGTVSGQS